MVNNPHAPVVVGVDGSDEALRAAGYGAWEADRRRVPLRLIFAHQPTPMWGPGIPLVDDYRWEKDRVRDVLARVEKEITTAHPGVTVQTGVVNAGPAAALVDESRHACLVVIGTRATGGFAGRLSGSVAAQVAAHAHTPVIVLRPTDAAPDPATFATRPVLVGLDGSPESEKAMEFAVEQAVARDAELVAIYVWNVLEVHDMGPIVADRYINDEEEAKALRLLTEATEGWSDRYPDLTITRRVIHALDAADTLAIVADDEAGLIVVGSRGHGGFLGLRLGSTVDSLIRHAGAPVAVVRGDPAA